MVSCCTAHASFEGRSGRRAPALRLCAALGASALLHVFLAASPHTGAVFMRAASAPNVALTVRLVEREPVVQPPEARAIDPGPGAATSSSPSPPARSRELHSGRANAASSNRPGDAIAHAPDTTYYTAREVDIYPALAEPLELRYPERAAGDSVAGSAIVELHIGDTGAVHEIAIVQSEPRGYFESELRETFRSARFTPAVRNGRAVRSRVRVRVDYGASPAQQ
jgi:protein TonB